MTLKEPTRVAGLPQSAGMPVYAQHVPDDDGIPEWGVSRAIP
jgi:hypothetical protein